VRMGEPTGNTIWAQQISGTGAVTAARLATDDAGRVYVAGRFEDEAVFGGATTLMSAGGQDGFLSKWDVDGNVMWAEPVASGAGNVMPGALHVAADGSLVMGYGFEGVADFDPGVGATNLSSLAGIDGAVLKLNSDGTLAWVHQAKGPGPTWIDDVVSDSLGNIYVTGFYEYSVTLPTGHVITSPGAALTYHPGNGQFLMKLALGDAPTKFYVADDGSANRTYEYQSSGARGDNSGLASGNDAPRGAASTAAGNRVWVVDANRNVYV